MVFVMDILSRNSNNSVGLESGEKEASIQARTFRGNWNKIFPEKGNATKTTLVMCCVIFYAVVG